MQADCPPVDFVARQVNHAHPVLSRRGQAEPLQFGDFLQEFMRGLDQHSRAIPRIGLCAARAAVGYVFEYGQPGADNFMRCAALDIGDKPDSAGIMLKTRVVQPLFGWQASSASLAIPFRFVHRCFSFGEKE